MRASPAILAALLLAGCVGTHTQINQPDVNIPIYFRTNDTDVVRRAVCIGLTNIETGDAPCPGCDVDARTTKGWMEDRTVVLLLNADAGKERIKAEIRKANEGMLPDDLLTVSISCHGTRRKDFSWDEADEMDEGLQLWRDIWWDDDVWDFICTLNPCRLELITDTCHAEGNWRAFGRAITLGAFWPKEYVQMEFDFGDKRGAREWGGQIVQWAGCREEAYSHGGDDGGTLTQTMDSSKTGGITRIEWFEAIHGPMTSGGQEPVFSTYNASPEMINGEALK